MTVANETELIDLIRQGLATEHRQLNLELKRSWDGKYGEKLSALANRITPGDRWLVVGVEDDGSLAGHPEVWAEKTEKIISQHVNEKLSPILACKSIRTTDIDGRWVIIITIHNPGDVVYWGAHAYAASGTTARALEPPEVLELRLRLPGLTDYTRAEVSPMDYDYNLVGRYASKVRGRAAGDDLPLDLERMLAVLNVAGRQTARLLFGDCQFRIVVYNNNGDVLLNKTERSLYRLLQGDFFSSLQARSGLRVSSDLYPEKGLREALANAVAHAAYFERDGDIIVELFPDRLTISNLCTPDSRYFANRWFSRSRHTINGLLMETLRLAGDVDELGRGKSLIFSESIKAGRRPPEVVIESAGRLTRWKLNVFATSSNVHYSRLLERCRAVYQDETLALIAGALVLWRNKKVSEIRQYVDGDFASQFAEVLSSLEGPIFYSPEADQIFLTRWARILLGEGKDSKGLSKLEEVQLLSSTHQHCWISTMGELTPSDLRRFCQMGDTQSEKSLSSRIIAKWTQEGHLIRLAQGRYRFAQPPPTRKDLKKALEELLASLREE